MTTILRGYTGCRHGQMHYLEGMADSVSAPTLILLHQNPSSSQEYEALVRAMAHDRRVIAFDTPGYGMSDPPPGPLSIAGYAACFSDAIDAMALDGPLDVYGFHTGALLAAELAIARPDKVTRIAMTGIPMYDAARCAKLLQDARETPEPTEDGAGVLERTAALWNYVVAQRTPGIPLDRAVITFADKNRLFYRSAWAYEGVWSYDYARLPLVSQPCCLVQPHEPVAEVSRQAAALIPDIRIVDLPDLNRDVLEVGVPQIAATLRAFFQPSPETCS